MAVRVARKTTVGEPVVIVHVVDPGVPGAGGLSAFPRTFIELGPSAEAGVVELFVPAAVPAGARPAGGEAGVLLRPVLVIPVTEVDVADDARLHYANLQVLDAASTCIATQASRVGRDAGLRSFTAGLGGAYARVRTDSDLVGQAGSTALLAAYLGTADQVHDFRTLQDHHAPRTESELLFKGAVADVAHSVYSGLIRIRKGAGAPTPDRPTTTSSCPRAPTPTRCRTSTSTRTTSAAATPPLSVPSTRSSATTSRPVASSPPWPSASWCRGSSRTWRATPPFPGVGRWVEAAVTARLAGRLPAQRAADAGEETDG